MNLWLTPDQQGRLWFQRGDYERASRAFEDPRWRGFSLYAAEDFATAERYFSQYQDGASLLARANALAHQGDYPAALKGLEELADAYPDHPAPAVNIPIMQALIEATKGVAGNREKEGDGTGKKPGEGSESSDGDGKKGSGELEQLSADQLLQDPSLTEMWLRQIQRDPSEFITTKFYLQLEKNEKEEP
ncbi:tetratricopeptide repeat protein [Haloferula sp.]|uniref:tetratricopeptide repeat protein n=1 Tax=Haloferula sp. TaxID=2497595 RepID=UPI00329A9C47